MKVSHVQAWPHTARTCDGHAYRIRVIRRDDAERERAFIEALSPESRYQRFQHSMREPSAELVTQLVDVDGHAKMALVATVGSGDMERIIGVARYAADEGGRGCEFAVTVADDWRCRGIGTKLAQELFAHAAHEGFRQIHGWVLADNDRMIALAEGLGLELDREENERGLVRAWRRLP